MEIEVEELDGVYEVNLASYASASLRKTKRLTMVITISSGVVTVKYEVRDKTFNTLAKAVDAYNEV